MTARLAYIMRNDNEFDPAHSARLSMTCTTGLLKTCGSTDEIVDVLSTAIFKYRCATEDDLDVDSEFIKDGRAAEKYFCDCMQKILTANGWHPDGLEDYAVWPDNLSVETTWEREVLHELALIQAGHDLVVRDQLKKLWAEEKAKEAAAKAE